VPERTRGGFGTSRERAGSAGRYFPEREAVRARPDALEELTVANRTCPATQTAPRPVSCRSRDAPWAHLQAHLGRRSQPQSPQPEGEPNCTGGEEAPRKHRRWDDCATDPADLTQKAPYPAATHRWRPARRHRAAQLPTTHSMPVQLDGAPHRATGLSAVGTVRWTYCLHRRWRRRELASDRAPDHIGDAPHSPCEARRGAGSAKSLPPLVTLAPAGEMPVPRSPASGIRLWRP
jgi:hypothetical protein